MFNSSLQKISQESANKTENADLPVIEWNASILFVQSWFIIMLNMAVVTVILMKRRLRKKLCNMFLIQLLLCHLYVGVSCFMFSLYQLCTGYNPENGGQFYHTILAFLPSTAFVMTFSSIILVTIEKLIAIKKPFFYAELDYRFFVVCSGIGFLFPLISTVLILNKSTKEIAYKMFVAGILCVTIILSFSNIVIYKEVRRQFTAIASNVVTTTDQDRIEKLQLMRKRQNRSVRVCFLIVLTCIICWLPACFNCFIFFFFRRMYILSNHYTIIRSVVYLFACMNSITDPIIFTMMNKEVRNGLTYLILRKYRKVKAIQAVSLSDHTKSSNA